MKNIAYDLDEVLVESYELWKHIAQKAGFETLKHKHFRIITNPPMTDKDIMRFFTKVFIRYHDIELKPDARRVLQEQHQRTQKPIYIITNRPAQHATETIKLINRLKVPYCLTLTNNSDDKWKYLSGYDYFVEDRRRTARLCAAMGTPVLMPGMMYNDLEIKTLPRGEQDRVQTKFLNSCGDKGIIPISSLTEVLEYL